MHMYETCVLSTNSLLPFYVCQVLPDGAGRSGRETREHLHHMDHGCDSKTPVAKHVAASVVPVTKLVADTRQQLQCHLCQRKFVTKSGLRDHVNSKHRNLARYRCAICGKGYSCRSHYHDHLATHSGVKRNECPICQRVFTFKSNVKSHVLRFHPNEAEQDLV